MAFTGIDSVVTSIATGKTRPVIPFTRTIDTGATTAAGRWHSMLTTGGTGGAMTLTGTAGTGIVLNSATVGALTVGANVATDIRHLLSFLGVTPSATVAPAVLVLTDLLHVYPSCALTGAPTGTSNHPTWTGTGDTRMTNAVGVQCSLLVTTATTAGNGQITPSYLDEGGAGPVAAPASLYAPSTTTPTGCFYGTASAAVTLGGPYMALAAGDTGVQRISSYAINVGATTGVGAFILHRPIASIPLAALNTPTERSFIADPFVLPRIYDDACLGLIIQVGGATTTGQTVTGHLAAVWG
jgi:hypothetical protein